MSQRLRFNRQTKQQGLSLIDLVLALALAGVLIKFGWQFSMQQHYQQQLSESAKRLDQSLSALEFYLLRNAHLPCPDTTGDGLENRHATGRCLARHGRLPNLDLMLTSANDGFGQPIYYAVHQRANSDTTANNHRLACASASVFAKQGAINNSFHQNLTGALFCTAAQCGHTQPQNYSPEEHDDQLWCQATSLQRDTPPYFNRLTPPLGTSTALLGSLRVCTENPNECRSNTARSQHAGNQVVALLVSFGSNAQAAWQDCSSLNPREQQNCNHNAYFQLDPVSATFDDQLRWLTIHRIKDLLHDQLDWHQTAPQ